MILSSKNHFSQSSFFAEFIRRFTMNSQTLTKTLLVPVVLLIAIVIMLKATAPTIAQAPEREFEQKIPKHLPIKIKLKADKEREIKDLKNTNWVSDFAVEVTNTS